jgi:DnaJ-class molecular chaperone
MQTNKNLYQLLGLTKEASEDDIQRAHRRLVREHHPDANPEDPQSEERFKEIQQAYEVLSDENKRREYDKTLHASSKETVGRTDRRGDRAKPQGDIAYGTSERANRDRGPWFKLGYLLGIALVTLWIALLILFIVDLD